MLAIELMLHKKPIAGLGIHFRLTES